MPVTRRSAVVAAPPAVVWQTVADPHRMASVMQFVNRPHDYWEAYAGLSGEWRHRRVVAEAVWPKARLGLVSMRERAEFVGGSFVLHSAIDAGTEIEVRVPWSSMQRAG